MTSLFLSKLTSAPLENQMFLGQWTQGDSEPVWGWQVLKVTLRVKNRRDARQTGRYRAHTPGVKEECLCDYLAGHLWMVTHARMNTRTQANTLTSLCVAQHIARNNLSTPRDGSVRTEKVCSLCWVMNKYLFVCVCVWLSPLGTKLNNWICKLYFDILY